jgi:hypothetical protein
MRLTLPCIPRRCASVEAVTGDKSEHCGFAAFTIRRAAKFTARFNRAFLVLHKLRLIRKTHAVL